jgi:hypothetical protein
MNKFVTSKAEEKFAKAVQVDKKAAKEREKADQVIKDKTARLRALRLAKEATEKEAALERKSVKEARMAKRAATAASKAS